MIEVRFLTDDSGRIRRLSIAGHAGLSSKGSDVLCAAVSSASYILHDGIREVLQREIISTQSEGDFQLELRRGDEETEILFSSVLNTLNKLARQYPDRLVIRREEHGA